MCTIKLDIMKSLVFLLIILGFSLLFGCKSYKEEFIKFRPYKIKDFITKDLEIYKASESLYPVLDSIIMKTEQCPMYHGLKEKIAFNFSVHKGYISGTDEISPYPYLMISVVYAPKFENHAKWTDAIFYYKGYDFYFKGKYLNALFAKTGEIISIPCIDPKKYQIDMPFEGGEMYWWYEYRNDSLINTSYGYCIE